MTRVKIILLAVGLTAVWLVAPLAWAELTFTDYNWTGGGTPPTNWQVDGNWAIANFPNSGTDAANVSVGSDLTLEVGATNVTVGALTIEGTTADTDINIASAGGGHLILKNDDDNTFIDLGLPEVAPQLDYVGHNLGRVYVTSNGVAGSTNVISAPVRLDNSGFLEGVDFHGTSSIELSGNIDIVGDAEGDFAELRSYLPDGAKVLISGDINLTDAVDGTTARSLLLNRYATTDHADPPRGTIEITGKISGAGGLGLGWDWFPHAEQEPYDPAPPPGLPLGTVILSGDNDFTGDVLISRGNTVLRHDNALGNGGTVSQAGHSGASKEVGYNLVVDAGDRTVSNPLALVQWQTIKGNSSLTWTGIVYQDGTRGVINLMEHDLAADTGATLTFSGPVYARRRQEGDGGPLPGRIITFDGTGKTVITGGIHNVYDDYDPEGEDPPNSADRIGFLRKRGSGTLIIDYDEANTTDSASDYSGLTWVEGGNLHFGTNDDLPNPGQVWDNGSIGILYGEIVSSSGAVGVDAGVVGNSTFLGMLSNVNSPTSSGTTAPFFFEYNDQDKVLLVTYDSGGLMLAADEYDENLDFTTGDLANAASMSLAAHETGSTYTGTITPSSSVYVNPDTYQLGGGSGTLTLSDDAETLAQLLVDNGGTPRNLMVKNGGAVRLERPNTYTGKTTVLSRPQTSLQEDAARGTADENNDNYYPIDFEEEVQVVTLHTSLTVTTLADGGVDSSIGKSSSDAGNLVIQGSTLKYVGGATSTDRLFTVGTAGATIDASGTGALTFANSGALMIDVPADRAAVMAGSVGGNDNNEVFGIPSYVHGTFGRVVFNTDDLVPGMGIQDISGTPQLDDDLVITSIVGPNVVRVGEEVIDEGETPWDGIDGGTFVRMMTFGPAPARTLTLTGSNADNNTLTPVIADASNVVGDGGKGSVGVAKTGTGTWILAGANTYTGPTSVQAGTLIVTGSTGTGDTTVAGGATLGGDGTIGGNLIADGSIAPGMSPGTLSVAGDYTQNAGATLEIDIAGLASFDVVDVTGTADLAGLIDVLLDPGFTLGPSDSFEILTAATLIDSGIALASGGDNDLFTLDVNTLTGMVTLNSVAVGLLGDYNGDGTVDAGDYTVWRDTLGSTSDLRANGDDTGPSMGVIDEADYAVWKLHFGETLGSGSGSLTANTTVPEPSALCLAVLAIVALAVGRRR